MNIIDSLFKTIENGKKGRNIGIPTGLPTIDRITYGVQKSCITTVFADTGAGKSTYTLFSYVYQPLKDALENGTNVAVLFFSFELSKEVIFAKLLSLYLYDEYKQVVSYEEIMSLTSTISDETFNLVSQAKAWLETIESYITIIDKPIPPIQVDAILRMWNTKYGKFVSLDQQQEDYITNLDMYKIVIMDHVKLAEDNGKGTKSTIDEIANSFIYYRNKCKITGIFVQQANRNMKSMDRRNGGRFGRLIKQFIKLLLGNIDEV